MLDVTETDLSEEALDELESSMPALATVATRSAHIRALASGLPVVKVEGAELVAIRGDGNRVIVGQATTRRRVPVGQTVLVRCLT